MRSAHVAPTTSVVRGFDAERLSRAQITLFSQISAQCNLHNRSQRRGRILRVDIALHRPGQVIGKGNRGAFHKERLTPVGDCGALRVCRQVLNFSGLLADVNAIANETIFPVPRLSSGVLGFPDFRGFTRSIVLWNLGAFFALLILTAVAKGLASQLVVWFALDPNLVLRHGALWQLLTYCFIHLGILGTAFELLSLWFLGSFLETNHGSRWLAEIFFVSVLGAGLAAVALSLALPGSGAFLYGCYGGIFGLLIAFGVLYADMPFMMFPLPISIKAKYLVAVYMLIALAMLFSEQRVFAFSQLGGALFGFLYIKLSPRRGFANAGSETFYGWRNRYYRWKRRRAAKKFEVYMRKHRDN